MLSSVPQGLGRFLRALSSPVQKETKLSRDPAGAFTACIAHPCCLEPCSNWLGALSVHHPSLLFRAMLWLGALTVCIAHHYCLELWLGALTASIINLCCLEQCSNRWGALTVCITPHCYMNSALSWTGVFLLQGHILYLFQRVKLVFQCGYQSVWSWECRCSCFLVLLSSAPTSLQPITIFSRGTWCC